ncbi:hypothetical protein [Streptomyces somaliensis]|uniref:hypothetical protein n=1 Tax=Streptomyces somaliensis TaxID=78355 RepID=UPI0035A0A242
MRAFPGVAVLSLTSLTTSAPTPAWGVRDRREAGRTAGRVDRVRPERPLAEYGPSQKLRPAA